MAGDSMRELVVDTIRENYKNGLTYIPFWGRTLGGIEQPEDYSNIPIESLEKLLWRVDNRVLLEILDSQACDKYR